ncbi:MAG: hypothetical protein NTV22_13365 [bacterium]|nr:hypothetical protein [bacterium]
MKNLMTCLSICAFSAAVHAGAGVTGTIDASPYSRLVHDLAANSLAMALAKTSGPGSTVVVCTFTIFDPKAQKKVDGVLFAEGIGAQNVAITYFDKKWAVLLVETTGTDTYFSVKLSAKNMVALGSRSGTDFRFKFMSGKNIVSYINATKTVQLFDANMQPLGAPATVLGTPNALNAGGYFYCGDGTRTQIWKVDRRGFTKLLDEAGDYKGINEAKRLCCIEDGATHKLCKY